VNNVIVQRDAFVFCRYSVAMMVWAALLFRNVYVLAAVFAILALSALLKVPRAPMVWAYEHTVGRAYDGPSVILDVRAMQVAHTAGAVMAFVALALVAWNPVVGWPFVAVFALLKTASALGFCPAYKLYGCVMSGGCCALTGKR
jgi:hypothetical protein